MEVKFVEPNAKRGILVGDLILSLTVIVILREITEWRERVLPGWLDIRTGRSVRASKALVIGINGTIMNEAE